MLEDEAARAEIEAAVRARLPGCTVPWSIEVAFSVERNSWSVVLSHEASAGLVFDGLNADPNTAINSLDRWLTQPNVHDELARISAAPRLDHAEDVLEVRTLASIFDWTATEVRAVSRLVQKYVLNEAEAEWLIGHIGRDEQPRRPTFAF